ncbi:hypothetical protein RZE82_07765 [Mollicutes bacterium LVI A0039]|nr:hypothetical protein RZE82_07765 [Mollicutes bacterium LVI A0039]
MDYFTKILFVASIILLFLYIFIIIILTKRGYSKERNLWGIVGSLLIVLYLLIFHIIPILNYYYKKEFVYLIQYQALKERVSPEKFNITYYEKVEFDKQSFNILISSKSSSSNFNFEEMTDILYLYHSSQNGSFLVDRIRYTYTMDSEGPKTCHISFSNYDLSQVDFEHTDEEVLLSLGYASVEYENIIEIGESAKDKCFKSN